MHRALRMAFQRVESGNRQPPGNRRHPSVSTTVAYDFGVKVNILRMLVERGCRLTVVPAQTPAKDVLALNPDGVFSSNGPGDPGAVRLRHRAIKGNSLANRRFRCSASASVTSCWPWPPVPRPEDGPRPPRCQPPGAGPGFRRVMITSQNHGLPWTKQPAGQPARHPQVAVRRFLQGMAHRLCRPSASRGTRRPALGPTTWPRCSIASSKPWPSAVKPAD